MARFYSLLISLMLAGSAFGGTIVLTDGTNLYTVGGGVTSAISGGGSGDFKADGSVPMTANGNAGGYSWTNLATPATADAAATKGYVDGGVPWMRVSKTANQSAATENVTYKWLLDNTTTWPNENNYGIWDTTNSVGTFVRLGVWRLSMLCQVGPLAAGTGGLPRINTIEHGGSVTTLVSLAYTYLAAGSPIYAVSGDYRCTNVTDTFWAGLNDNDTSRPNTWYGGTGFFLSAVWQGY